jgi:hypothetical protein
MAYSYGPKGQIMSASEAQGRNTNAIMADWVDRGPWQYWDTITFPQGSATPVSQQYNPFSVPIGAQNPLTSATTTKTKLQTNMVRGNQFPPPRCLLLIAVGFYFSSQFKKVDIDKILDSCYMEFRIDDKIFHEGQLWEFPPGAGLMGVSTQTAESVYTLGLPAPAYQRRYGDWAKYIAPIQQFSMTVTFGGGGVAIPFLGASGAEGDYPGVLVVTLDGLTDRSVQ